MAGSQDPWRISGEERSKHDIQFFQLKPVNGFVTGTQARDFFLQSGLPTPVLGQIWTLADINGDGKMDKKEFSIAMHLIKKKLQGYELPKVLPPSLKADPAPVVGSFAQPTVGNIPMAQPAVGNIPMSQPMGFSMGGVQSSVGMGMPLGHLMQPQASLGTATMTTGSLGLGPLMSNGISGSFPHGGMGPVPLSGSVPLASVPGGAAFQSGGSIWAMPPAAKMKHTQSFNICDKNKKGYLLGVEARAILMQSGLPQPVLAQIWSLSDIDRDGKLTCDEFCIAMHLTELARMGQVLPPALPPELMPIKSAPGSIISNPPSVVVPGPQKDAFGDLLGSVGMPLPVAAAAPPPQPVVEDDDQVSFEDKRKENFDKGQAELERRRAILREQQQKEENERLEKERQEAEKRERQRQEVESRRQAELQKQLEKQKEREMEIEEQRRKVLEQREAARRELERQRQMEWEKQRKEQLLVEKEREAEQIRMIKSQMTNFRNELETLEARKAELALKVTQARKGVTDFTASIDAMRMTRDKTLADIDAFERQTMVLSGRVSALENEKNELSNQMQTAQTTPLSDAHRTIAKSVELKKASIQKLKKELEKIETDTEVKLREIDGSNAELKNLKEQLTKLERDLPHLQKQQEEKIQPQKKVAEINQQVRKREFASAPPVPSSNAASNGQPNWFDFNSSDAFNSGTDAVANSTVSWDTAFSDTSAPAVTNNSTFAAWGAGGTTTGGTQNKQKYRALYDFPAGREDELTLVAGMEVWVLTDFTPIPGMEDWYKGEHDGKMGWFPKSYVERLDEPSTDLFGGAFENLAQSSNVQTSETARTDIFTTPPSQPSAISSPPTASPAEASVPSDIPPEGLLAKAIYPWKARQETDLTFDKEDIILVKEQDDMKWFGELNGKSGWFPKAYVKLIGAAPKPGPAVNKNVVSPVKTTETSTAPSDSQGEYYSAMYTYTSGEPADLTFNEGDIIYVTATSGDWWSGTIADQNKSGIFPASYVKKLEIQQMKHGVSDHTDSSFDLLLGDFGSVFSPASSKTSSKSFTDDLLASPVDVQPRSYLNEDSLGLSKVETVGFSSATAVSSETKPDQSLSAPMPFDSFRNLELATSSDAASTAQYKEEDLSGFGQMTSDESSLGVSDDMLNLSLNVSIRSSYADGSGGNNSFALERNTVDNRGQLIISGESFIDTHPIANEPLNSFMKEKNKMDTIDEKSTTLAFSDGATSDLDWSFGGFEKPSASLPAVSDFSLLDDFGLNNTSNLSKPAGGSAASQGPLLDFMDDFGFGAPSASSSKMKSSSLKHSMSLPDILAMEDDAILGDLTEAQSTADILKGINIPMSASRTSSVVQVDLDLKTHKIGSKLAPIPPASTPSVSTASTPHFRSVAKTLFGRMKKKTPEQKSVKKPEIARVIAPYVATGTGQLSLEVGNLINVRQKSPRGWWEGELQVRGQKKKTGWFPANYVKLLSSTSARSTPEPTGAAALSLSDQGFRSATPLGTSSQSQDFTPSQPDTVVALYPYVAQNDDELTFQKDDVITVLNRDNPSWWSGQVNGHTGMFPINYVTPTQQS